MIKFQRNAQNPYIIITPLSPLSDLETFLKSHIFALGKLSIFCLAKQIYSYPADVVTDSSRKFVLAVATKQDLDNFVSRRGL